MPCAARRGACVWAEFSFFPYVLPSPAPCAGRASEVYCAAMFFTMLPPLQTVFPSCVAPLIAHAHGIGMLMLLPFMPAVRIRAHLRCAIRCREALEGSFRPAAEPLFERVVPRLLERSAQRQAREAGLPCAFRMVRCHPQSAPNIPPIRHAAHIFHLFDGAGGSRRDQDTRQRAPRAGSLRESMIGALKKRCRCRSRRGSDAKRASLFVPLTEAPHASGTYAVRQQVVCSRGGY